MAHTSPSPHAEELQADREGDHSSPSSGPQRLWLLGALAVAQLMLVLDVTVANVALPEIASSLSMGRDATSGVITIYALMLGGFMLLGGRASDLYGPRRVILAGLTTFVVASLAAALSWDTGSFLVARGVQGLGAALLSPAALAAITAGFVGGARHRALAVWGAVGGAGASVGVLLGGLLTSGPGWRWIFLINVPVGLLVLVAVVRLVPRRTAGRPGSLDVPGALTVTAATGILILFLTRFAQDGAWSTSTGLLLAAAASLYAMFVFHERRTARPLVDPRLLVKPRIATGSIVMLASSGLLVGLFFLLTFFFQGHLGWTPLRTGLAFLPIALGTLVGAHVAGHAVGAYGPRVVGPVAFLVTATGLGVAGWQLTSVALLISGVSVAAAGLGAGFVTSTTTALGDVDHAHVGAVSGVVNTFHELGAALGVAALSGLVATGASGTAEPDVGLGLIVAGSVAAGLAVLGALVIPGGRPDPGGPRFVH